MTRTIKALGLCLFAVCAFGAVSASSASAVTHKLTCAEATCSITAEQVGAETENVFGTKGSSFTVHCPNNKVSFTGTVANNATTATVHPTYGECSSTVDVDAGCNLILKGETDLYTNTAGAAEGEKGTAAVECGAGERIRITGPGCTISMTGAVGGANQALKGVTYTNETPVGKPNDVKIDVKVDNITYTASGVLCDPAGILTPGGSDAFLTEVVTVTGFHDPDTGAGTQIGLTFS